MKKLYSWVDYYMKDESEKGHQKSLNIIWNKLNMLKPKYWIHIEDDFLFFDKMKYIEKSLEGLELLKTDNVKQILFNLNYSETISNYSIRGHIFKDNGFALHDHKSGDHPYTNCHYWPHFSLRPSFMDVETILKLGNFQYNNNFFEMNYANNWNSCGYKSGFLNKITNIHIGRLTSERNDHTITNAYTLNNEQQFDNITISVNETQKEDINKDILFQIVNLERRTDRKETITNILDEQNINSYEFIPACDGTNLELTKEIYDLFKTNDFGSRKCVIACALSHYELWKKLVKDESNDFYIIMEDDFYVCQNFKNKTQNLYNNFKEKDVVFLGYHMYEEHRNSMKDIYSREDEKIELHTFNKNIYIGGFFSYSINKAGAQKLIDFININGIQHGIDYLVKVCKEVECYELQPHICFSKWYEKVDVLVDTDIQRDFSYFDFINSDFNEIKDKFVFVQGRDQCEHNLYFRQGNSINENKTIAYNDCMVIGFNTPGFFKNFVDIDKLSLSPYLPRDEDGIYIKKSYYDIEVQINEISKKLTDLVKNIDNIKKPSYCFIHSCTVERSGTSILDYLINYIINTSLILELTHIFIINIGTPIDMEHFKNIPHFSKITVVQLSEETTLAENTTINIIHNFSELNDNCNILYLHTKGITCFNTFVYKYINDWVNLMLHNLVDKHNFCYKLLEKYDAVGCNYLENPTRHFSGNFWWASSNYICGCLEKIVNIYDSKLFHQYRHKSEEWILSSNDCNFYCLYNSGVNHYKELYPKEKYIDIDIEKEYLSNKKYRVKLMCNWTSSEHLCKNWSCMCENEFTWKNIEIVSSDFNVDYYVIINSPPPNEYYDPKKTIIFQMEPWVNDSSKHWGVKSWGAWAEPDEKLFLSVNGRKQNTYNNIFWGLGLNLSQIEQFNYIKIDKLSSICSSKYFDPGHIIRIDLLRFLESKNDLEIDIYNQDNNFNFRGYKGPVTEYIDKYKGMVNYKYYFMIENNFEENFITEKLWEPILCESLVFYYGCPNVSTYVNSLAYVELDINDFEKCYQTIKQAMEEDWWSQRIDIIRQEKKRILAEMAFFPRIQKIIEKDQL
jgi:GR25 family glycosyltransferase involved in LPS biosynthesis